MRRPSSRMRKERVTLLRHKWGKDADAGRVISSTVTTTNVICSVDPGISNTAVDETGRWTTEQPYALRFTYDPILNEHDEVVWTERPSGLVHTMVVMGTTQRMGRGVTYEVNCIERT